LDNEGTGRRFLQNLGKQPPDKTTFSTQSLPGKMQFSPDLRVFSFFFPFLARGGDTKFQGIFRIPSSNKVIQLYTPQSMQGKEK
jgi:hypothetical protein